MIFGAKDVEPGSLTVTEEDRAGVGLCLSQW